MKKLHLICNAHIDPIWLWQWEEGLSCVLSTFRAACDLAEKFDYIFCHNEALLYEWVEQYDPELFQRIKEKIKQGKWKIMGGWYLQPDCNMPSGESFVRQIQVGKEYFLEKFGVETNTAINVDPFGHSIGLVQILKKCGYKNYMCCRPSMKEFSSPDRFVWCGPDGSEINVVRVTSHYNSPRGRAAEKIQSVLKGSNKEVDVVLWGVGNHGGGPSAKDLKDIQKLMQEEKTEIVHSCPDYFFKDIALVERVYTSLNPCMPGCYTSMIAVKQLHRALENEIYATEKMISHASLAGMEYPAKELDDTVRCLLYSEFHDILPGSCTDDAQKDAVRLLNYGLEKINRLRAKAFFYLQQGQEKAKEGEFPIVIYNPHPYVVKTIAEVSFNLEDQNWTDSFTDIVVYQGKKALNTQVVREKSNLNLDWMKKIVFECELEPMSVNRFDAKKLILSSQPVCDSIQGDHFLFSNGRLTAEIDCKTGMLSSVILNGMQYIGKTNSELKVYDTNEDPWAMADIQRERLGTYEGKFELAKGHDNAYLSGLKKVIPSVRIIEQGKVLTRVEAVLRYQRSVACVRYTFYQHQDDIDVEMLIDFNEKNKMLKWFLPLCFEGKTYAQIAYGNEELKESTAEQVMQKWVLKQGINQSFALINRGIYALSNEKEGFAVTLRRNAVHSAHPIEGRDLVRQDRFYRSTDNGEIAYEFKLKFGDADLLNEIESEALFFNEKTFALNHFPSGIGTKPMMRFVECDTKQILLTALKKSKKGGYIIRLFNGTGNNCGCTIRVDRIQEKLNFTPYEVKTLRFDGNAIKEEALMEI